MPATMSTNNGACTVWTSIASFFSFAFSLEQECFAMIARTPEQQHAVGQDFLQHPSCQQASCTTSCQDSCTLHCGRSSAIYRWRKTMDDAKASIWPPSRGLFHKSSLFRLWCSTQSDWISLCHIRPRILLDHDQPRFVVWQVMSPRTLLRQLLIIVSDNLSRAQWCQWHQHCWMH